MEKTEIIIKEDAAFRLKIRQWKAVNPSDLNAIEFVQDCINKKGNVEFTSTYQFNMTDSELKKLASSLNSLTEKT